MEARTAESIRIGSVIVEPLADEVRVSHVKWPDTFTMIPARTFESWCLRKLRQDTLQPERDSK